MAFAGTGTGTGTEDQDGRDLLLENVRTVSTRVDIFVNEFSSCHSPRRLNFKFDSMVSTLRRDGRLIPLALTFRPEMKADVRTGDVPTHDTWRVGATRPSSSGLLTVPVRVRALMLNLGHKMEICGLSLVSATMPLPYVPRPVFP